MIKEDFVKFFDNYDDKQEIAIFTGVKINGYEVVSENIKVKEEIISGKKVLVLSEDEKSIK